MKMIRLIAAAFIMFGLFAMCGGDSFAADKANINPVLSNDDCVKCHDGPPSDIASAGMKHRTITCPVDS